MLPLDPGSSQVATLRSEGKTVKLENAKTSKRRSGGWAGVMPDIEWFVRHGHARAQGKPVFLWGFSMGGGQVLGFATRGLPPPSREAVGMLSGVIAGGPLIRLVKPAPWIQVGPRWVPR